MMGQFVQLDANALPAAMRHVREAVLESNIPWEHRHYAGRRTSLDHDLFGILSYLLDATSYPRIDDNWLTLIGAISVSEWQSFPVYRFELPIYPPIQDELFEGAVVQSVFELSPNISGGWLGTLRTTDEGDASVGASSGVALIANRLFVTRADLVMFLWLMDAWPVRRPETDSGDSVSDEDYEENSASI